MVRRSVSSSKCIRKVCLLSVSRFRGSYLMKPAGFEFPVPNDDGDGDEAARVQPSRGPVDDHGSEQATEHSSERQSDGLARRTSSGNGRQALPNDDRCEQPSAWSPVVNDTSEGSNKVDATRADTQAERLNPFPQQLERAPAELHTESEDRARVDDLATASLHARTRSLNASLKQNSPLPNPTNDETSISSLQSPKPNQPHDILSHFPNGLDEPLLSSQAALPKHPPTPVSTRYRRSVPQSTAIDLTDEPEEIELKALIKAEAIASTKTKRESSTIKQEPSIKAETIDLTSEPERAIKRKPKPTEPEEEDEEDLRLELRKIEIQQRLKKMLKQRGRRQDVWEEARH